jgi:hypothetical protein
VGESLTGVVMAFRERDRLGYRAKYPGRFAEFFAAHDPGVADHADKAGLMAEFRTIKGIGPYTAYEGPAGCQSNSPSRAPVRNAAHSVGVNRRIGPSPRSFESRTALPPSGRSATSTQLLFPDDAELFFQFTAVPSP